MSITIQPHVNLRFNYAGRSICCSTAINPTCTKLSTILDEIESQFKRHKPIQVKISFQENYLEDEGLQELADFLETQPKLAQRLIKLNLEQNRLTVDSIGTLRKIVSLCPNTKFSININEFTARNLVDNGLFKLAATYQAY